MTDSYKVELFSSLKVYHIMAGKVVVCKVQVDSNKVNGVFIDKGLSKDLEDAIRRWAAEKKYECLSKMEVLGAITFNSDWQPEHR